MPSISQAKLNEIEEASCAATASAARERDRANQAAERVRAFDSVLDKIVRAADGRPLTDERNGGGWLSAPSYGEFDPRFPPSVEERRERDFRELHDRIVGLESRLAAVKAVAQFAKEHKA